MSVQRKQEHNGLILRDSELAIYEVIMAWDTVTKQAEASKAAITIISTPVLRFTLVVLNAFFKNRCITPILQLWKVIPLGQVPCLNKSAGERGGRKPCSRAQGRKGREWGCRFQQQPSHVASPIPALEIGKRTLAYQLPSSIH